MTKLDHSVVMQAVREAAEIVKVYCHGQVNCESCILQGKDGGACDIPENWQIKKPNQEGK